MFDTEISSVQGLLGTYFDYITEQLLQIFSGFRTYFVVYYSQLFRLLFALFFSHFSNVPQIDFVPYEESKAVSSFVLIIELQPALSIVQRGFAADIKDDQRAMSIFQIPRNQRFEPLLPSSIPELQSIVFGFVDDVLG